MQPTTIDPEPEALSTNELETRIIYSAIVAGKSAKFTDAVMKRLLTPAVWPSPFAMIRELDGDLTLFRHLRWCRTGNYTKLARCFRELADSNIDLATCTPEELEAIHGIGPKTSRFFIIWTRPGARHAALDVHVLRWLADIGHRNVPRSTPSGPRYRLLEQIFLDEADARGVSARELDHAIWMEGSRYSG